MIGPKEFSNTLKLMVDKHYQPSASIEDKNVAKNELNEDFEKLMNAISGSSEGIFFGSFWATFEIFFKKVDISL